MNFGYISRIAMIKVKNETNEKIEKINVQYDNLEKYVYTLKNIKSDSVKEVGMLTHVVPTGTNINIYINKDYTYVIKESIVTGDSYNIWVYIDKVTAEGELEFRVIEEK